MIRLLIFDWGDTIMRDDPAQPGPMAEWKYVEAIPGAQEILQQLSSSFTLAVATNAGASDTTLMRKALQRVDVEKYFSWFTSSKDLGVEKPDPEFFLRIVSHFNLQPSECIHIGNVYSKDITGAFQAGLYTIFFNEKKLSGDFPEAHRIIGAWEELPQTIHEITEYAGKN
jgi:putative hydrolase of the HAD superfamily